MRHYLPAAVLFVLVSATICRADEKPAESAESLARVQAIKVTVKESGKAAELITRPVLRFGDPARSDEEGSIWVWGSSGRPLAFAEIYHKGGEQERWVYVMTLTSRQLISASTPQGRWTPQSLQFDPKPIEDVTPPADQGRARLLQMRQIARRYAACEYWDPNNSRYELRLLPSPLHRYEDAEAGIVDGAVFAFAHGTNPEILMLVEAHSQNDQLTWQAGFASLGSAEMQVTLEDTDIWRLPRAAGVSGTPNDPYWLFVTEEPVKEESESE